MILAMLFVCLLPGVARAVLPVRGPQSPWKHNLVGDLRASQVSLKDWTTGGDDAVSWEFAIDGNARREDKKTRWNTVYRAAFGQTKLGSQVRKSIERLDLETTVTLKRNRHVNPYLAATLKTQLLKGYRYSGPKRVAISDFMDPVYLKQSAGVGFAPLPSLKTRVGLAVRETLTRSYTSYSDHKGTAKLEKRRIEGGSDWVSGASWKLATTIILNNKLEVFTPFFQLGKTVVRSENTLSLKLSKHVALLLDVRLVKNGAAGRKWQIRQSASIGLKGDLL